MGKLVHFYRMGLSFISGCLILYGCYGIFTRAVFGTQSLWANDLLLMGMVSVLWLFSVQVVLQHRETTLEAVIDAFHGRKKVIYQGILDLISCACTLLLGLSGMESGVSLYELGLDVSNVLPVPQWVPVLCFVVAMFGSSAAFLYRAVTRFRTGTGVDTPTEDRSG